MTTNRLLPIINLVGCLLITGIIFAQWLKERGLDTRIGELNKQLAATREQYAAEKTRAAALENDVAQLKESLASTVQARKEADDAMAKLVAESNAHAAGLATANQEQVKVWEKAIADRDEKIRELNTGLTAARERLNEAIAKLKEAGAR